MTTTAREVRDLNDEQLSARGALRVAVAIFKAGLGLAVLFLAVAAVAILDAMIRGQLAPVDLPRDGFVLGLILTVPILQWLLLRRSQRAYTTVARGETTGSLALLGWTWIALGLVAGGFFGGFVLYLARRHLRRAPSTPPRPHQGPWDRLLYEDAAGR